MKYVSDKCHGQPGVVIEVPDAGKARASNGSPAILASALGPFKRRFTPNRPVIGFSGPMSAMRAP